MEPDVGLGEPGPVRPQRAVDARSSLCAGMTMSKDMGSLLRSGGRCRAVCVSRRTPAAAPVDRIDVSRPQCAVVRRERPCSHDRNTQFSCAGERGSSSNRNVARRGRARQARPSWTNLRRPLGDLCSGADSGHMDRVRPSRSAAGEGHHVGVVGDGDVVLEGVEVVEEAVRERHLDRAVGVAAADPLAALDDGRAPGRARRRGRRARPAWRPGRSGAATSPPTGYPVRYHEACLRKARSASARRRGGRRAPWRGRPSPPRPRRAGATAGPGGRRGPRARSPNSHGRPRQPRPTTTPSQPVARIIATASAASQMSPLPSTGIVVTWALSSAMASQRASPA